jgi:fatty-acyl-CoA synthase
MRVSLSTADHCHLARSVHGDRLGGVDEPDAQGNLGRLTYGDLMDRCDGMIEALERNGISPGERVAVVSPNSLKMLIALYAVLGSGRVLVPINFRLNAEEVQFIVADSGARILFVDPELDQRLADVTSPRRVVLDGEDDAEFFAPGGDAAVWGTVEEDATATINYTSGTTSRPKGVILSHRAHCLNALAVATAFGVAPGDRYLHTLPIFHVNGWGMPLISAALGIPQIIQREVRGAQILERVGDEEVTLLCGATPVAATIARSAQELRGSAAAVPGAGRTRMVSGGAPTPAAVIQEFEERTGWEMIHAYGLTECAPVLTTNRIPRSAGLGPAARAERLMAAGAPLLGVRLRTDPDGELQARTGKAMTGYWGREDLTAAAFDGEWLRTGDGGEIVDGVLRLTDRKKDVIVSGGENISSVEIEACIQAHPDIDDVAVIGVPDPRWGETPKALVVGRPGAVVEQDEILAFCRERIAHFKCPTSVDVVDELPRTATGKVQKFVLRERFGNGGAGEDPSGGPPIR